MDTGPVLLERRVAIADGETAGELLARLGPIGAEALIAALGEIAAGKARPMPQDHDRATHAPMLAKGDGAIDFAQPATMVAARIRGVDPWPGAQAMLRGQVVKLFRARIDAGHAAAPGTVLGIDAAGARVACGDGVVVIADIQVPGRKRVTLQQAASGRAIAVGDVLGRPEPS
jgi:methionyl-tRNA formyltransferase